MEKEKVIKALECCCKGADRCGECPYLNIDDCCLIRLPQDALAVIKQQEKEIAELNAPKVKCKDCVFYIKEFQRCEMYKAIVRADDFCSRAIR